MRIYFWPDTPDNRDIAREMLRIGRIKAELGALREDIGVGIETTDCVARTIFDTVDDIDTWLTAAKHPSFRNFCAAVAGTFLIGYVAKKARRAKKADSGKRPNRYGDETAGGEFVDDQPNFGTGKLPKGRLTGSLKGLTADERRFITELLDSGINVEIVPRSSGKTADFLLNGKLTELKTVAGSGATSIKNALQQAAKKPGTPNIIIDARPSGLSPQEALKQAERAQGNVGGLQGRVLIITTCGNVRF